MLCKYIKAAGLIWCDAQCLPTNMSFVLREDFDTPGFSDGITKMLVHFGIDFNESNELGLTTLHQLGMMHDRSAGIFAKLMIDLGSPLETLTPWGETPLHIAAEYGSIKVVTVFVDKGANLNARTLLDGRTPLHSAVARNHVSTVRFLLSRGARLSPRDNMGMTPIHLSISQEMSDVLQHELARRERCEAVCIGLHHKFGIAPELAHEILEYSGNLER
jgi:ankyrin repeat protein